MWHVDKAVEEFASKNVDCIYPQFLKSSGQISQSRYPQLFFSIYKNLEDLLGFPRPYYYY